VPQSEIQANAVSSYYFALGRSYRSPRPIGAQFADVRPLGKPGQDEQNERQQPEPPERDEAGNARRDAYSVTVEHQGAAYGGSAWNDGGRLADSISSSPGRASIELTAGKVIQGSIIPAAIEPPGV
jgi:hypothetical protein